MTRIPFFILLCACGTKANTGPEGPAGAAGAQGAKGDAGVCDLSSCPATSSIDGLSGGTVHGATTFTDTVNISRVVVTKGTESTSTNAFYCGATTYLLDGAASKIVAGGIAADNAGAWAANKDCQDTCSSPTAHVCTSIEFIKFQALRAYTDGGGGEATAFGSNHGVPMPLAMPTPPAGFERGWIYAADGLSSCQGFTTSSVGNGVVFRPGDGPGYFLSEPCTAQHPLYCCD